MPGLFTHLYEFFIFTLDLLIYVLSISVFWILLPQVIHLPICKRRVHNTIYYNSFLIFQSS
jgi:hypothetical protein